MSDDAVPRDLLVLIERYPPDLRVFKLTRHLLAFGWRATFLAGRRHKTEAYFGAEEIAPGLDVRLTYSPQPLSRMLHRLVPKPAVAPQAADRRVASRQPSWRRSASAVARRAILWLGTPDERISWLPWAVHGGRSIIKGRAVRAILASGPPFSILLAGVVLKRLSGLPLIADFRDAWAVDETDPFGTIGGPVRAPYGRRRVSVLSRAERYVLARADLVLFTSDYTMAEYCRQYPSIARRSLVLYNGVDEEDFEDPVEPAPKFSFTHAGTIHEYQYDHVTLFLTAFAKASIEDPRFDAAEVYFVGPRSPTTDVWLRHLAERLGIAGQVTLHGVVRHKKAMQAVRAAGVLLLFAGENRFVRLSKISPYLAARRPILAFAAPESETGRHVREAGHALFEGTSVDDLAALLGRMLDEPVRKPSAALPFSHPHPLHWHTSAMRLAAELDRLAGAPARGPVRNSSGTAPRVAV